MQGIFRLSKAEFLKLFRSKKAIWKNASKCTAVLVVLDFRKLSDGKKQTVVLPFRKKKELQDAFKELKKLPSEQKLPLKKVAACSYELLDEETLRLTILKGGADAASCQMELQKLFTRLQLKVLVSGTGEGEANDAESKAEANSSSNPRELLLAAKTSLEALAKLRHPAQIKEQYQAILKGMKTWHREHQQKARPQHELKLLLKMKEALPKVLETARLNVFESYLDKVEKQPELLVQYRPQLDKLIAQLKAAASVYSLGMSDRKNSAA